MVGGRGGTFNEPAARRVASFSQIGVSGRPLRHKQTRYRWLSVIESPPLTFWGRAAGIRCGVLIRRFRYESKAEVQEAFKGRPIKDSRTLVGGCRGVSDGGRRISKRAGNRLTIPGLWEEHSSR
jgi:hypothetical protein